MYRLFALLILFLLTACGTSAQPTAVPTATIGSTATATQDEIASPVPTIQEAALPPANIRIIHAAPQTESVNISLGEFLVASYLSFGVSTSKTQVPAGDYTLRIMASNAAVDSDPLYETELSVTPNASLILVFTGTPDALTLSTYPESNDALGENEARVTAIHAVPRGVDFTLRQNGTDLTPAVTFGQVSVPVILPPGQTTVDFQSGATPILSYPLNLQEGVNYTLVLVGRSEDLSSLTVIAFSNPVPGRINVRAIHAAVDVNSVDFYLDDERIGSAIDYSRAGDRLPTSSGTRVAAIYEAGADPATVEPLFSQTLELPANSNISLILTGSPTYLNLLPFVEDLSPTPEGETRISFVNTLEAIPVAQVSSINGTLAAVYYGQQGEDATFTAGIYTLFWDELNNSGDNAGLEIGSDLEFVTGRAYLYLLTGRDVSEPPIIFSEDVGTQSAVTDEGSAQVRFVNAIGDGTALDFYLDSNPLATGIPYGQRSDLMTAPTNTHIISVRVSGATTDLASTEYTFSASSHQTLFAYGDSIAEARIRGLADSFAEESDLASARLVNLSSNTLAVFGLAYTIATVGQIPTAIPTEEAVDQPQTFRQNLPLDTQIVLQGVHNETNAEMVDTIAIPPGSRDIFVLDSDTQLVGAYINAQILDVGTHYDIVAFQSSSSPLVRAFVVSYPIIDQ